MVWHVSAECRGAVPRGLVTAHTISIRRRQRVVVVGVALGAWRSRVCPGERKAGGAVVPGRCPVRRGVATRALRSRETGRYVVRYSATHRGGVIVLVRMAAVAVSVCRREIVIVIGVAARTGSRRMRAGERPAGNCVVEGVIGPRDRVVAGGAIRCRKSRTCCRVRWVVGLLPSR